MSYRVIYLHEVCRQSKSWLSCCEGVEKDTFTGVCVIVQTKRDICLAYVSLSKRNESLSDSNILREYYSQPAIQTYASKLSALQKTNGFMLMATKTSRRKRGKENWKKEVKRERLKQHSIYHLFICVKVMCLYSPLFLLKNPQPYYLFL